MCGRWHTIVCIASGPSLSADDCAHVQAWRAAAPGRGVIVVNTSFRAAPWADVLYAMDNAWWTRHRIEVRQLFRGRCFARWRSMGPDVHAVGAGISQRLQPNSGAAAIELAAHWGARRIVLLGYDCQRTDGRAHWHGDHPKGLGNAGSLPKWPAMFRKVAQALSGRVEIVNGTRQTALRDWPRLPLEEALTT